MNKRTPRKTAEQWAQIIADFTQSVLSADAYCEQHRLVPITFHKWKRRLLIDKTTIKTEPAFLPVQTGKPSQQTQSSVKLHIGPSITLIIELNGVADEC